MLNQKVFGQVNTLVILDSDDLHGNSFDNMDRKRDEETDSRHVPSSFVSTVKL
jgi:hypothetical protein